MPLWIPLKNGVIMSQNEVTLEQKQYLKENWEEIMEKCIAGLVELELPPWFEEFEFCSFVLIPMVQ